MKKIGFIILAIFASYVVSSILGMFWYSPLMFADLFVKSHHIDFNKMSENDMLYGYIQGLTNGFFKSILILSIVIFLKKLKTIFMFNIFLIAFYLVGLNDQSAWGGYPFLMVLVDVSYNLMWLFVGSYLNFVILKRYL